MKNLVIAVAKVFVTTALVIGFGNCSAQDAKVLSDDGSSKSSTVYNPKNGHFYEFVGVRELTWTQAKQKAASRYLVVDDGKTWRGYLATLTKDHEQALLEKHYADPPTLNTDVWLGASDDRVDDEWRWVTGPDGKEDGGKGKLFFKDGTARGYINWRSGEPNNSGGIESFLQWNHYLRTGDVPGTWNDQPINKKGSKGYFVEYDDSGSESPPVYNPKNGHYYEFVGERELTWTEAKQKSESRFLVVKGGKTWRGYLATLTKDHEQALLEKHYADPPTRNTDVWLGASDERVDDEWRWVTGPDGKEDGGKGKLFFKNGRPHGYMNWRSGEPNNSGGIESFLQWNHYLRKGDVPGTWNDQPIDKPGSKGYFVEYGGT